MKPSRFFTVLSFRTSPPAGRSQAFLIRNNWDDMGQFETLFELWYADEHGRPHDLGEVKIGQFGMGRGHVKGIPDSDQAIRSPAVPAEFDELDDRFFSLGQDPSYYEKLLRLDIASRILGGLRDLSSLPRLLNKALREPVTQVSLLRYVSELTVRSQFSRIIHGQAKLTPYSFRYKIPQMSPSKFLEFEVAPHSMPPTNIHVLIGQNATGKTRLLNLLTRSLVGPAAEHEDIGYLTFDGRNTGYMKERVGPFSNVVGVTFSAFDVFVPLGQSNRRYVYVGLHERVNGGEETRLKDLTTLAAEFGESAVVCNRGARASRWRLALQTLSSDPIFRHNTIVELADEHDDRELQYRATQLFKTLSSGHKLVLLSMTKLVELVQERTLILFDEPETHLHAPLLSSFVRALSDLVVDRNAVAILATHSPVVLQEVPRSCVWKLRRSGDHVVSDRPKIETFGENVGTLTREIFGLEATQSGFYQFLEQCCERQGTYESIVKSFSGQLGAEAKAILRALIASQQQE